jgi:hypothetical protein
MSYLIILTKTAPDVRKPTVTLYCAVDNNGFTAWFESEREAVQALRAR